MHTVSPDLSLGISWYSEAGYIFWPWPKYNLWSSRGNWSPFTFLDPAVPVLSWIWISKPDFTWLIVISHRYVLGFTLWSQLTPSISHDNTIACYLLVVICWLRHDSQLWSYDVWLSPMTHSNESWVSRLWPSQSTWLVLWVLIGFGMLRSWLIAVSWWISHYESLWVMSCVTRSMSHIGLG